VAYILDTFPSLSETFILDEIIDLERRGVDLVICALNPGPGGKSHDRAKPLALKTVYSPPFTAAGPWRSLLHFVRYHPTQFFQLLASMVSGYRRTPRSLLRLFRNLPAAFHFAEVLKARNVQHIVAHFASIPATLAMIVSQATQTPFSISTHAWDIYANRAILEQELGAARFVVTCTKSNREHLVNEYGAELSRKIHVVYHGVDIEYWQNRHDRGVPDEKSGYRPKTAVFRLMAAGRLVEKKGFSDLIKVCSLLVSRGKRFHLYLAGAGRKRKSLERLTARLGLEKYVSLVGTLSRQEMRDQYATADLFIVPSIVAADGDRDGLPNVLLEAMAMGVPVVATRISAIPELIENGKSGILAPEKDHYELGAAITELLDSAELRKEIAAHARRRVTVDFDSRKTTERLYVLLHKSCQRP